MVDVPAVSGSPESWQNHHGGREPGSRAYCAAFCFWRPIAPLWCSKHLCCCQAMLQWLGAGVEGSPILWHQRCFCPYLLAQCGGYTPTPPLLLGGAAASVDTSPMRSNTPAFRCTDAWASGISVGLQMSVAYLGNLILQFWMINLLSILGYSFSPFHHLE